MEKATPDRPLQEQLDAQLARRTLLLNLWLVYGVVVLVAVAMPRMAVRLFGPHTFWVALIVLAVALSWVGLILLTHSIYAQREIRLLRLQLKEQERLRRKRKRQDRKGWWRSRRRMQTPAEADYREDDADPAGQVNA